MPDAPADGIKMKENNYDAPDVEQIKMLCDILNVSMSDLCYTSYNLDNEMMLHYKKDYLSIIETAVTNELIVKGILEQSEFLVKKETQIILARTMVAKTPEGKPLRDANNKLIMQEIPEKTIITEKSIIEAPNAWFLSGKSSDGKVIIEDKILDRKILKGLTVYDMNIEDFLHDRLKVYLDADININFNDALHRLISEESNLNEDIDQDSKEDNVRLEDINLDIDINLNLVEKKR